MRRIVKIILLAILGVCCLAAITVGALVVMHELRFRSAESTLLKEFTAISLPADYVQKSRVYTKGYCFDNCPKLVVEYTYEDVSKDKVYADVKATLVKNGYRVDDGPSDFSTFAFKNKSTVSFNIDPEHLILNFEYKP